MLPDQTSVLRLGSDSADKGPLSDAGEDEEHLTAYYDLAITPPAR